MLKKILYCLVGIIISTECSATNIRSDIEQLLDILYNKDIPTLEDYYYFYGQHDEFEAAFVVRFCKNKGWTPPLKNLKCLKYIRSREANRKHTPSLFLIWLKSKLPKVSHLDVTIHGVKRSSTTGIFKYEKIKASLDGTTLVFFRPLGKEAVKHFGLISIISINGIPIEQLMSEELEGEPVGKDPK